MAFDRQRQEWSAGAVIAAGAGILTFAMFANQSNELLFLGFGLLIVGLVWLFVSGSRPLRIAAGLWLASVATFLATFVMSEPIIGGHVDGPRPVSTVETLLVVSWVLVILALVQTVRTFRPSVAIALVGWMIAVGIPVIFRGGSVHPIVCTECPGPSGDLPWEAIWVAGSLAIIAIGFVTRKRASVASLSSDDRSSPA